jgi:transcriptional regulator with XRE-family HTH domain
MMTKQLDDTRQFYLRERRLAAKLTQEEIAFGVGTSKSMISQMETGSHAYNERWVSKISAFLGIVPAALFIPPGECFPAMADQTLAMVINAWPHIDEAKRIALAHLADTFQEKEVK